VDVAVDVVGIAVVVLVLERMGPGAGRVQATE
jgi:hypothetical protein